MKIGIFTYADTLTGGNLRLVRALRYYPKDEFMLFIPSDKFYKLKNVLESLKDPGLENLEKMAVHLKPMGHPGILGYVSYGKYVGEYAKKEGIDLLYLYHEHAYFPFGFSLSGIKWTMLVQLTPVIGSIAIEEGKGFDLFRKNYSKIYGYGYAKSLKGYLRLKLFSMSTGNNTLIAASKSVPYELGLLGIKKKFEVLKVPSGFDGCLKKSAQKDMDVVYFSRVVKEKGIFHYFEVLSALRNKIKSAYIVGYCDERMKKIVESELERRKLNFVKTLYNASKEEAHEAVSRSKLLIYPSMMDAFSLSLMESLACGTPAVAYGIPGIRFNYETPAVRLVKPLDFKALAEETGKILESGAWQEMLKLGLEYSKNYKWEAMVENEVKVLEKLSMS